MKVSHSGNNPVHSAESGPAHKTRGSGASREVRHPSHAGHARASEAVRGADHGVKASISRKAREAARARELASRAPDVREERVAELKRRIAQGGYHVDADAIADRMLAEHLRPGIR